MGRIKDMAVKKYAAILAEEGRKLIVRAYESSSYNHNRTQNLRDSYGSAVYYNGALVAGTKRFLTSRAVAGKYNTYTKEVEYGRTEIEQYLDAYSPRTRGFELVIAVAMFYGEYLEKQRGSIKRKYKVVSHVISDMNNLAAKYGGIIRKINL